MIGGALRLGLRTGRRRFGAGAVVVLTTLAVALATAVAGVESHHHLVAAPTRALHACLGVILPLFSFVLVGRLVRDARLGEGAWSSARFGWPRAWVVLGELAIPLVLSAVGWMLAAGAVVIVAYRGHAGWQADLLATLPVAALGGLAHVAWYAAGATFLRLGRGRWATLGLDWFLGGGTGILALPWPRSHVQSLLGGPLVAGLDGRASSAALLGIVAFSLLVVTQRAGR